MPAWTLGLQAIPSAVKLGYLLTHKPKYDDYHNKGTEGALERIISNNQADIVNKTLYNQTTAAAKSLGSRLYQQHEHGLEIAREKGLLSEGQHAQALLGAGTDIQTKVGEQQESALLENTKHASLLKQNLDQARLQLGQVQDEARRNFQAAKQQRTAELFSVGMDFGAVAANVISQAVVDSNIKKFMKKMTDKFGDPSGWDNTTLTNVINAVSLKAAGYDIFGGSTPKATNLKTGNKIEPVLTASSGRTAYGVPTAPNPPAPKPPALENPGNTSVLGKTTEDVDKLPKPAAPGSAIEPEEATAGQGLLGAAPSREVFQQAVTAKYPGKEKDYLELYDKYVQMGKEAFDVWLDSQERSGAWRRGTKNQFYLFLGQ